MCFKIHINSQTLKKQEKLLSLTKNPSCFKIYLIQFKNLQWWLYWNTSL